MQQLYFKYFGILFHPCFLFPAPCFWSSPTPGVSHLPLGAEALAQLSSARCFEGSSIPSLLLAQETEEVLLWAELPPHWLWSSFPACELIPKIRSQFMEENRGTAYERRHPIYLMVQMSVICANKYFTTDKTENTFGKECPSVQPTYCFYSSILKSPYYVWAQSTKGPSFTAQSQAL